MWYFVSVLGIFIVLLVLFLLREPNRLTLGDKELLRQLGDILEQADVDPDLRKRISSTWILFYPETAREFRRNARALIKEYYNVD